MAGSIITRHFLSAPLPSSNEGFLYDHGNYQRINYPDGWLASLGSINDDGIVVGYYSSDSCQGCGFVFRHGTFLSFRYPGAFATLALGINNLGQIVGLYEEDDSFPPHDHGFVTSPITAADFKDRP